MPGVRDQAENGGPFEVIAFGANGPQAPSFRIRTQLPRAALASHGIEVRALPLLTDSQAKRFARASVRERVRIILHARSRLLQSLPDAGDVVGAVWIQRQIDMLPGLELERRAAAGHRLVVDVDDAIWLDHTRDARQHPLAFLKGSARKIRWLASTADQVIAGNDFLAEWLSDLGARVAVVPSLVDPDDVSARAHAEHHTIRVGWIGSRSTAPYLRAVVPRLEALAGALPGTTFELLVVGGPAPAIRGIRTIFWPWSETSEREALASMDIGIMPLPDSPWTRGKCAYKALQYMAAGIPVVADDVGVSAEVVGDGRAGYVLGRHGDWTSALLGLASDVDLRKQFGAAGRARVIRDYSPARWAPVLAALLRGHEPAPTDGRA